MTVSVNIIIFSDQGSFLRDYCEEIIISLSVKAQKHRSLNFDIVCRFQSSM